MSVEPSTKPSRMHDVVASITMLTALPMPTKPIAPRRGAVLTYAPLVGILLGAAAGSAVEAGRWLFPDDGLLIGVLALGVLAGLTRALHLDGLADTVDGMGPFRDRERALAVMRQSDIGAFGVVALLLVLLADATAIARDAAVDRAWCVAVVLVASRVTMTLCGRRGVPAARPDGLGASVAGSVSTGVAAGSVVLAFVPAVLPLALGHEDLAIRCVVSVAVVVVVGQLVCWRAVRRFGGITGDVLGAVAELSTVAGLVATAIR